MDDNYRSDRLNQICLDDSRRSLLFHDFKICFLITVVTGMQVQCSTSAPKYLSDEVVFLGPGPMQYVFERWAIGDHCMETTDLPDRFKHIIGTLLESGFKGHNDL